ncbi:MAG: hypothetical protein LBT88_03355 [Oscillospiraceae bacterium]|nr:hypothetical protein [Oscillospiraceae bacterium]
MTKPQFQTPDLTAETLVALAALFPNAVPETADTIKSIHISGVVKILEISISM